VSRAPRPQLARWALPTDHLLHDDGAIVVVSKPTGLSVAGSSHDLTSRVRLVRQALGASDDPLCPQTHLDRDTSGVVVFAASKEARSRLAHQTESPPFAMTFVAGVELPRNVPDRGERQTAVVRDRQGVMHPARGRGDKKVRASYRVLSRDGARVVLEAQSPDGPRAIRAVLASMGATVVGDAALGSVLSPRMMLHARDVTFQHPLSGEPLTCVAPVPGSFAAWLHQWDRAEDLDGPTLANAIREAATARYSLLADGGTDAVRLVHGEGEGLLGLDVEWYAKHAVVWVNDQTPEDAVDRFLDALAALAPLGIYVKRRPKQASRVASAQDAELVIPHVVRGQDAPEPLAIREGDIDYLVQLGKGLSTGLFLDQRQNRAWVRARSGGASVLNLFAYTCSFTVAAAAGGAHHSVSVDISKRALEGGASNLARNGLAAPCHELVCDDVQRWVARASRGNQRFDLVILDPPSFGTSPWGRFSAMRDYRDLAAASMSLLKDGGWLLACTNHRGVGMGKLRDWLRGAARSAGRGVMSWEEAPAGLDFPVPPGAEPHLKAIRCQVGGKSGAATGVGRSSETERNKDRLGRSAPGRKG
jgi:23S rRNA (cytosine1962-C5)-methyltransferase